MFPVSRIDRRTSEAVETLGTKPKFWFTADGRKMLFKAEERGTGEDWAEKIACHLCERLGLPHVHYELAEEYGRIAGRKQAAATGRAWSMTTALFVAWRGGDANHGAWGPVGRLEHDGGLYRFCYTHGARTLPGFQPFPQMYDLDQVYESEELFPLFANRLLSPKRPEYEAYICGGAALIRAPSPTRSPFWA